MLKKYALAAMSALVLFSAGAARARIADFQVRSSPAISAGDTVTALDFSPDGRFLIILHGQPGTVSFFDTWDMALLSGTTADVSVAAGGTEALSLSVSPYKTLPFAYVGLSSGEVAVIDYTGVAALGAVDGLTAKPPVTWFQIGANPIGQILAAPEFAGGAANVYLLAGLPNSVSWTRLAAGKTPGSIFPNLVIREPLVLARGAKYSYLLSKDTSGRTFLNEVQCLESLRTCTLLISELGIEFPSSDLFSGLAADRSKDLYSVTMNRTRKRETLMANFPTPAVLDTFTVADAVALASAPTPFDANLGDVILAAGGSTVSVADLAGTTVAFGGSYAAVSAGGTLTTMVASGGSEGYAFAGRTDGLIVPFTANPWVNYLTAVDSGATVGLRFSVSSAPSVSLRFSVFKNVGFRKWPASIFVTGTVLTADTLTTASIAVADLKECKNALTLIVQDTAGRQGRAVAAFTKDTNPPAPNFTLGFGRQRVVVNFKVSDLCDLNSYAIFWGDTNSVPVTDYNLLASYGDSLAVNAPVAGENIQRVISGLTDGKRYWVQLVAFDAAGNVGVSSRLSATPQAVNTVASASGEKGGFSCLGSIGGGGDPRGLVGLFLPLLIYAVLRVSRGQNR